MRHSNIQPSSYWNVAIDYNIVASQYSFKFAFSASVLCEVEIAPISRLIENSTIRPQINRCIIVRVLCFYIGTNCWDCTDDKRTLDGSMGPYQNGLCLVDDQTVNYSHWFWFVLVKSCGETHCGGEIFNLRTPTHKHPWMYSMGGWKNNIPNASTYYS